MRIGIYDQPSVDHINGIQASIAVLAAGLRDIGPVEIVTHDRSITIGDLTDRYDVELEGIRIRRLERQPPGSSNPWRRYRMRKYCRELSEPYDLFICFSSHGPPFCYARHGVLMVVFPHPMIVAPGDSMPRRDRNWAAKDAREVAARMASYTVKTANSAYSRDWTRIRWGVDCDVIYAPADLAPLVASVAKERLVLSVGRFAGEGIAKRQREMMLQFRRMRETRSAELDGWRYVSVGPLGKSPRVRRYFDEVGALARSCGAAVHANIERARLRLLYGRAKIFWHATGYGVDTEARPELVEHFGIVTVEAMAAGCVPVVANAGGQPEIVEHGVSGFLWDSFEELREYTHRLMADDILCRRMSAAASERARSFGREAYVARFHAACAAAGVPLATPSSGNRPNERLHACLAGQ